MSGDYSRLTFDPHYDFIAKREQQGRVRLDADFNEYVEIVDRHTRAETVDIIGKAVVPQDTTDAFVIKQTGTGTWLIGPGRMYVDGMLAECWGAPAGASTYDPTLGEMRGNDPLPFDAQPFYYKPNFPAPTGTGTIVYLDVWTREVTTLENADLRDKALGGIDTVTHLQTAWQVKALNDAGVASCVDVSGAWTDLTAPSSGCLTTSTVAPSASVSPCIIDPVGGYTGLENRLYRVQIHDSGTVSGGTPARFVYSHENAAFGARILGVTKTATGSTLSVSRVGRDQVLRFATGDVIEVLDDFVEWSIRDTGHGGQIVHVQGVSDAAGTIDVDADLTAFFSGAQRPRVIRWDAEPVQTIDGTLAIGTEGIQITFGPTAANTLRAGDWWTFAARTADGTIDILTAAPPRGTLHHYAKLATITAAGIQDCRIHWPPATGSGCCTKVLSPSDDVQAAIDSLPDETGGCICLRGGIYPISQPLMLKTQSHVVIHSEAPRSAIVRNTQSATVFVAGGQGKTLDDIALIGLQMEGTGESAQSGVVNAAMVTRLHIVDCSVGAAPVRDNPQVLLTAVGVGLRDCTDVLIERTIISDVPVGVWSMRGDGISIEAGTFSGPSGQQADGSLVSLGLYGIVIADESRGTTVIADNAISDYQTAISMGTSGKNTATSIRRNQITRHAQFGTRPVKFASLLQRNASLGVQPVVSKDPVYVGLASSIYAIDCSANSADISDNVIDLADPAYGGIASNSPGVRSAHNVVISFVTPGAAGPTQLPYGIVAFQQSFPITSTSLNDNTLTGSMFPLIVASNVANKDPAYRDMITVQGNSVSGGTLVSADVKDPYSAIKTAAQGILAGTTQVGILVAGLQGVVIAQNTLDTQTVGIALMNWVGFSDVRANRVNQAQIGLFVNSANTTTIASNSVTICAYGVLGGSLTDDNITAVPIIGNVFQDNTAACVTLGWEGEQIIRGNIYQDGVDGLTVIGPSTTVDTQGNTFVGLAGTAVTIGYVLAARCTTERVEQCAVKGVSSLTQTVLGATIVANLKGSMPAVVIAMVSGSVELSGCEIRDTGSGSANPIHDALVLGAQSANVRGNTIVRRKQSASVGSSALVIALLQSVTPSWDVDPLCHANVHGNSIDTTYPGTVAKLVASPNSTVSSISFNSNVVEVRVRSIASDNNGIVWLSSTLIALAGNTIHALNGRPPLYIDTGAHQKTSTCTATANVTRSGDWLFTSVLQSIPTPYKIFNIVQ